VGAETDHYTHISENWMSKKRIKEKFRNLDLLALGGITVWLKFQAEFTVPNQRKNRV